MEKRTFRENSVIFEPTKNKAIDQAELETDSDSRRTPTETPFVAPPNKIPEPVQLNHLPDSLLKTGAVNSLIQQNEDLISRLGIAIRRYSKIEEELDGKQNKIAQLQANESHYKDQCLIYQKKIELIEQRTHNVFATKKSLEAELELLETRYAELYSSKQEKVERALSQKNQFQSKAERLSRYRGRIQILAEKVREELSLARHQAHRMERDYLALSEDFRGIKERLSATVDRLQTQSKEHQTEIAKLSDGYETQLANLQTHLDETLVEFEGLKNRNQSLEKINEKCVELENKLIFAERKLSDLKDSHSQEVEELQGHITKYRMESKERTVEIENIRESNQELSEQNQVLSAENQKMKDQIESLQVMWNNNHTQLENEKEKNKSLQKLNQQISLTLNEARLENRRMKDGMESQGFNTKKLISELEAQIQMLGEKSKKSQATHIKMQPEVVEKIESLIAEVQSGTFSNDESTNA